MTLITGISCKGGIVFGADSEESGIIRRSVDKVTHNKGGMREALWGLSGAPPLGAVMIAGAGHGTLCDYAAQKIAPAIETLQSLEEVEQKITEVLRDIYTVQVPLHPVDNPRDADFSLLIGVKPAKWIGAVLYSTEGVTVVKRERYFVLGTGALTEYILNQMYRPDMSIEEGTAAALYMLQLAKKYVGGVGGESKIVILRDDGSVEEKPFWEIANEEKMATQFSMLTGRLLLSAMGTRQGTDEEFAAALSKFNEQIKALRENKKESENLIEKYRQLVIKERESDK